VSQKKALEGKASETVLEKKEVLEDKWYCFPLNKLSY
jgi:hypothetical protein